ncbi:glucan 1,4-alpha-glucosidase [Opitutaceae bacterium EW11]|nr:glucan 1,4-alpha-glucosidase [Opitutaceae bacterium EW11]
MFFSFSSGFFSIGTSRRHLQFSCPGIFAGALLLGASALAGGAAEATPAFRDPALPLDTRVADLVSRLSLDEKAGLMKNATDGVPRLGIPKYDWWNEALHGVARAGDATVFPQAIGLAATWDDAFVREVADTISTEARAKYNEALAKGNAGERYRGLTFWTPNINIFRDPRWGRGQETYGEDPYLTGRIGVAFVRGLQGDDPRYLKTSATAKHLVAHSGPEATRYKVNVEPPKADLYETYLPAFEALVREGRVESVMTAYNALYGEPCSSNPFLYGILRSWGFSGHVVCDCGAVYCIYEKYQLARDFPEAEARAVKAGLSLRCGLGDAQLAVAVRRGLLTEAELDAGLTPLLRTLFRLGFFDPADRVPFSSIPVSENNSPAHAALALDAAQRSIVLLKNDGALPLDKKKLRRLAVIGPNADSVPVLLGNYHGTPTAPVTVLAGLRATLGPGVTVEYSKGCDYAEILPGKTVVPRTALSAECDCGEPDEGDRSGLMAEYFANPDLAGAPAAKKRNHQIEFAWGGKAPADGVPASGFSVRWTGTLTPALAGEYAFTITARGGVRFSAAGTALLDAWTAAPGERTYTVKSRFSDGSPVRIELEYSAHAEAEPSIALRWTPPPSNSGFAAALANARAADAVVFVGGISPELEGEDMRVDYDGFSGGDRTRIELPAVQQRLLKALAALGKPLIFVNLSGSAVAFPEIDACANAIVQGWYPGQSGGIAIADVLFGRTNPAGRLPVTFYASTSDLPDFADYHMANRTYRYFTGKPLYPFGHGLSYTTFAYRSLRVAETPDGSRTVTVDVTNSGKLAGDEVVQLYLQEPASSHPRASKTLAGFRRIALRAGETQTVALPLTPTSFRRWNDEKGAYAAPSGTWTLLVGSSSADIRIRTTTTLP